MELSIQVKLIQVEEKELGDLMSETMIIVKYVTYYEPD